MRQGYHWLFSSCLSPQQIDDQKCSKFYFYPNIVEIQSWNATFYLQVAHIKLRPPLCASDCNISIYNVKFDWQTNRNNYSIVNWDILSGQDHLISKVAVFSWDRTAEAPKVQSMTVKDRYMSTHLRRYGDTALALEADGVHGPLVGDVGATLAEQAVHESSLSVVYMGNNGDVAETVGVNGGIRGNGGTKGGSCWKEARKCGACGKVRIQMGRGGEGLLGVGEKRTEQRSGHLFREGKETAGPCGVLSLLFEATQSWCPPCKGEGFSSSS